MCLFCCTPSGLDDTVHIVSSDAENTLVETTGDEQTGSLEVDADKNTEHVFIKVEEESQVFSPTKLSYYVIYY